MSVRSVPRTGGATTQAASRVGDWVCRRMSADREEDERRDEEPERQSAPAVEGLTESGEDGRQTGRGEAATVGRSGVRPDPAGVHAGSGSSESWGARRPRAAPESSARARRRDMETPGDRSACP